MSTEPLMLTTVDYCVLVVLLLASILIGIYYGFFAKQKQNSISEYLFGSKNLSVWPVALSLTATHLSATAIVGVPSEVYKYGSQYWASAISGIFVSFVLATVFVPVFYELQLDSCFEYLERRFDKRVRRFAGVLYFSYVVLLSPLMIFAPSLCITQVSQIDLHVIAPIICAICVFYTAFGGLRAVVVADSLQFTLMILTVLCVLIIGSIKIGGLADVIKISDNGGRLILANWDPNPLLRDSIWMILFGLSTTWIANTGVVPEFIQRFNSVPTLNDAKKVVWISGIGSSFFKILCTFNGLLIYANYKDCDPVFQGDVGKYDQIFPYFVLDVARLIPGLPGLFMVGVLSAALSTLSSCLNSLSGIAYNDFIRSHLKNPSEKTSSNIMKLIVLILGIICLGLVFVVEKLGGLFSISLAIFGITSGPLLGVFLVGMLSRKFNKTGALWGGIISLLTVCVVSVGAQFYIFTGILKYPTLPFNVGNCTDNTSNSTIIIADADGDDSLIPDLFRLNYMYYSLMGVLILVLTGYPISLFFDSDDDKDKVHDNLLAPFMRSKSSEDTVDKK